MAKTEENWGASPAEWQTFIDRGMSEDILPVVSNPGAPVSEGSTMKQLGKTPSIYNGSGKVCGIAKWTSKEATEEEVEEWSKEPDYGICIQTRHLRGIDIDIDDKNLVNQIVSYIQHELGGELPLRYRDNSAKCLLAVVVEGEIPKQVLRFEDGGMVEFLGNGQQFVAAGTHPSGDRYQWSCEIDEKVKVLSQKEYEALIFCMEMDFDVTRSKRKAGVRRHSELQDVVTDDTVQYLEEHGHVKEYGSEGEAHIECPFADEHTTESSISATTYFPAGSRGYERGHFVCLHAHCEARTDTEFEDALGIRLAEFQEVVIAEGEYQPPELKRDKHGQPKAIVNNVVAALNDPEMCAAHICYDRFRDEIIFYGKDKTKWERENDERFTKLRMRLEGASDFLPIGRELIRDAARVVAKKNEIDTATEWLQSLEWDGVERIERFIPEYLGGRDGAYERAISLYIWTAAAGRVMEPGLKADMIPIMKGPQGFMKSTAIAAMAPSMDEFCEVDFDEKDDDLARKMRGVLVCEIPELRGLRTRAIEAIKAFVARTHEKWIPKYKEFSTSFPRRCVFIATTNDDEFLADNTGNRRWLPFDVHRKCDVEGIRRDRDQLWAEAAALFTENGLLFGEAERLAVEHHEKYMMRDAWYDVIVDWLDRPDGLDEKSDRPADREYLRAIDVAREAFGIDAKQVKRVDEMKIADTLKALGYENGRRWVRKNGKREKVRAWFAPHHDLA